MTTPQDAKLDRIVANARRTEFIGVSALAAEDKPSAATSNPFGDVKSLLGKV